VAGTIPASKLVTIFAVLYHLLSTIKNSTTGRENLSDQNYTTSEQPKRYRPARRAASPQRTEQLHLTEEFLGAALAFGSTLLFIGYEIDGVVEVVVYPRYRFPSDDRVQGQLGNLRFPLGTPWEEVLGAAQALSNAAQENYSLAVSVREAEMRAHGSQYESAYDAITDAFRESWHGFALKLGREGRVKRDGVLFTGTTPGPVLAEWRSRLYTVMVAPTGSIMMLTGDRRSDFRTST
jgi:hypothetical protein